MEVSAEEASLQRSQQLRELYDTLSSGDHDQTSNQQPPRRPSAALSPEDLTESEWFYLMCVSFSFPPGEGLPGRAYAKRQHLWLTGANEADSKFFTRAILAKSARVQTVVCIPLLDGVVELGTVERVKEDLGFVQHIKSIFAEHHELQPPPLNPELSEHSTSNPAAGATTTSSSAGRRLRFDSSCRVVSAAYSTTTNASQDYNSDVQIDQDEELAEEEEEEDGEADADADADHDAHDSASHENQTIPHDEINNISGTDDHAAARSSGIPNPRRPADSSCMPQIHQSSTTTTHVEPSCELMQVDMSEDIRVGSPEDHGSINHWDSDDYRSDLQLPRGPTRCRTINQLEIPRQLINRQPEYLSTPQSTPRWPQRIEDDPARISIHSLEPAAAPTTSGGVPVIVARMDDHDDELGQLEEDSTSHYSQTLSTILHHQYYSTPTQLAASSIAAANMITSAGCYVSSSTSAHSAFSKWPVPTTTGNLLGTHHVSSSSSSTQSQWTLKYILFTVPFLHSSSTSPKSTSRDHHHHVSDISAASPRGGLARRGGGGTSTPQEEVVSANHVLAERRRREKLNERFIILRSLVPFVTKMDKASILGDTIEYLKQLRKKIQQLEAHNRQILMESQAQGRPPKKNINIAAGSKQQQRPPTNSCNANNNNNNSSTTAAAAAQGLLMQADKRKMRIVLDQGTSSPAAAAAGKPAIKAVVSEPPLEGGCSSLGVQQQQVDVSIIESDALVELKCPHREGILLDVMQKLRELRVEITAVQSSVTNGSFLAELRAKVKENAHGRRVTIMEVKKAIHQIIPQYLL